MSGRSAILVVCGLPAAGKSTFCDKISKLEGNSYISVLVSFDSFLGRFFDVGANENAWKLGRRKVVSAIETLISFPNWNAAIDSNKREFRLLQVTESCYHLVSDCTSANCQEYDFSRKNVLYILDDNFFYESMRYEIFRIAKEHRIGFGQIYLDCSLSAILRRNAQRNLVERVPEETIMKMSGVFEQPKSTETWQRNTKTLHLEDNPEAWTEAIETAKSVVQWALDNPVLLADEELFRISQAEKDRQQNLHSVLHQAELLSRKLVSLCMKPAASSNEAHEQLLAPLIAKLPKAPRERLAIVSSTKQKVIESVHSMYDPSASLDQFIATKFADYLSVDVNAACS